MGINMQNNPIKREFMNHKKILKTFGWVVGFALALTILTCLDPQNIKHVESMYVFYVFSIMFVLSSLLGIYKYYKK